MAGSTSCVPAWGDWIRCKLPCAGGRMLVHTVTDVRYRYRVTYVPKERRASLCLDTKPLIVVSGRACPHDRDEAFDVLIEIAETTLGLWDRKHDACCDKPRRR